jgi:hypothetical protein
MHIPVVEAKKFQIRTLPSYLTESWEKKLENPPPNYQMKQGITAFLATHKEEAFDLDQLYEKVVPLGFAASARTGIHRKWLCELFNEGNISAGKVEGQIYFYFEPR